ncbi:MAG: hypothetical protein ACQEUT_06710 [Bacillota bacterium]
MKKVSYGLGISLLLLAGCGTAEESTEANPADAEAVKETQEETFETNDTDVNANSEDGDAEDLTKEKANEVLTEYKDTFMEVIDKGPELEEYGSEDEIIQHFSTIMTEEQARSLADIYINDRDGKLSVVATEAPIWLKDDQEYKVEKVSEEEQHVIQNSRSQMRGNLEVTFVLVRENDSWLVSKTETDQLEGGMVKRDQEESSSENNEEDMNFK